MPLKFNPVTGKFDLVNPVLEDQKHVEIAYYNEHTDGVGDYSTGNNATFDNGGTIDGTFSSAIAGGGFESARATYLGSTASTNDWISTSQITVLAENYITFIFYANYTAGGADDDIKALIWDDTNNVELQSVNIKAGSNIRKYEVTAYIPSGVTALKFGFFVVTGNNGALLAFDKVQGMYNAVSIAPIYNSVDWQDTGVTATSLLEAVTSNPTPGVMGVDEVYYARRGKMGKFSYRLQQTATTGAAAGSGDYLFTLPLGLSFDTSVPKTTNAISGGDDETSVYGIHAGAFIFTGTRLYESMIIVPYDDTRFRVFIHSNTNSGAWSSTLIATTNNYNTHIEFEVPILGWTDATNSVISNQVEGSNWTDYTPTTQGIGTPSFQDARWKRVGDTIYIQGRFTTGTVSAVEFQLGLPSGLSISTAYNTANVVGWFQTSRAFDTHYTAIATAGDTYINIGIRSTGGAAPLTPQTGSTIFVNSEAGINFWAQIKIEGWDAENQFTVISPLVYDSALRIKDGITAPATDATYAQLYVDSADGDLKIKFADGTVKTIVTDT